MKRIAILGGGTAGWMTAIALIRTFGPRLSITRIEPGEIVSVGVGEATIPTVHWFNELIGLDRAAFLRETKASFKLSIGCVDWARSRFRYFHPFGRYGVGSPGAALHHRWPKAQAEDLDLPLDASSLAGAVARDDRLARPTGGARSILSTLGYARHFDIGLYARNLRSLAEAAAVMRIKGRDGESGFVTALSIEHSGRIAGDLFIKAHELSAGASWLAVLNGRRMTAQGYNPAADTLDPANNRVQVAQIAEVIARAAPTLPKHDVALATAMESA